MASNQSELTRALMDRPGFTQAYAHAQRHQAFGALLRALREEQGLSQASLAERAGVDQGDVSRFEAGKWGKRGISYEMLDRLLPVLGLRLEHRVEPVNGTAWSSASRRTIAAMSDML